MIPGRVRPRSAVWVLAVTAWVTVDRVEVDIAVIEWPGGVTTDVPVSALPPDTREGDRLRLVTALLPQRPLRPRRAARRAAPPVSPAGGGWSLSSPTSQSQEPSYVQP